jgi:hypothetical protein
VKRSAFGAGVNQEKHISVGYYGEVLKSIWRNKSRDPERMLIGARY